MATILRFPRPCRTPPPARELSEDQGQARLLKEALADTDALAEALAIIAAETER